MKLLNLLFKRETAAPMLALMFASVASLALVLVRITSTGNIQYAFLVWNLFLAWLPLMFALLAREEFRADQRRTWRFFGLAGAWLLFFPNASYIFTDLIHLWTRFYGHFWIDLTLILICAVTGMVLGFVSLYLMQSVVARMFGRGASWLFVVAAAGLSSVGVYFGRFLHFNSWDVFLRPQSVYRGIDAWMESGCSNRSSAGFLFYFATFLLIVYVMLYALTHLPKPDQLSIQLAARR
jgi:uncharacterized membrane protein